MILDACVLEMGLIIPISNHRGDIRGYNYLSSLPYPTEERVITVNIGQSLFPRTSWITSFVNGLN